MKSLWCEAWESWQFTRIRQSMLSRYRVNAHRGHIMRAIIVAGCLNPTNFKSVVCRNVAGLGTRKIRHASDRATRPRTIKCVTIGACAICFWHSNTIVELVASVNVLLVYLCAIRANEPSRGQNRGPEGRWLNILSANISITNSEHH